MLDLDKAVTYLDSHAIDHATRHCAEFVRHALEAGGAKINPRPEAAKDYGPTLENAGFKRLKDVDLNHFVAEKGDIIVLQPVEDVGAYGHIAMFDGEKWVSDFKQHDMWAGPGYRAFPHTSSTYAIYRP